MDTIRFFLSIPPSPSPYLPESLALMAKDLHGQTFPPLVGKQTNKLRLLLNIYQNNRKTTVKLALYLTQLFSPHVSDRHFLLRIIQNGPV